MKVTPVFVATLSLLTAYVTNTSGQIDPKHAPKPPTAELAKFNPFLGKYQVSGDFAKLPWKGTLEWRKVVKGWWVEQIILIKSPGIDREFWLLATWDDKANNYPIGGFFQTLPVGSPPTDAEVRFDGRDMITQWSGHRPDGTLVHSSNVYRFDPKGELDIWSYRQVGKGPKTQIGYLNGKRISSPEP